MNFVDVKIKVLEGGKMPVYKHKTDACCDCYARLDSDFILKRGKRCTIPLGFKLDLPDGFKAVIDPRSGLASKDGIVACIGEIDEGYKGELGCTLFNLSEEDFHIYNEDRICQLEFVPYYQAVFEAVDEVSKSDRDESGFGSSGVKDI